MANQKISADTMTSSVLSTDYHPSVQGGANVRTPYSQLGVLAGSRSYVDSVNGSNDATNGGIAGYRSRPFLTLSAAEAAAPANSLIHVFPGTYTLGTGLGTKSLKWWFDPGCTIIGTDCFCFDVQTGITLEVAGYSDFIGQYSSGSVFGGLRVNHASAVVRFNCKRMRVVAGGGTAAACYAKLASYLEVNCSEISGDSSSYYVLYWENGETHVNSTRIFNEGGAISAATVYCASSGASQDMYVTADEIYHGNANAFGAVALDSAMSSTAAVWINAKRIRCNASALYSLLDVQGGKLYVVSEKLLNAHSGGIVIKSSASANFAYITSQKTEGATMASLSAGNSIIDVGEHNDSGLTGTGITVSGGEHDIALKRMKRTASGVCLNHAGGITRLSGRPYFAPIDGASNYPITVSANGLDVGDAKLIAPATPLYTINGTGSPTVVVPGGAVGNKTTNGITAVPAALPFNAAVT